MIRVYDDAGNVIATHEHNGDFKEVKRLTGFSQLSSARYVTDGIRNALPIVPFTIGNERLDMPPTFRAR